MDEKVFTLKDFMEMPEKNIYETAGEFQKFIDQFSENKAYPYGFISRTSVGKNMGVIDYYHESSGMKVSFITNNYLGMNQHPEVIEAVKIAAVQYGTGTCAAPPIGGCMELHRELELKLAKLHDKEDAILYTSGYTANIGVFQNLFNKRDMVLVDMFVHASIYDGLGNTNKKIYRHNDMDFLEMVLKREQGKYRNLAIVVDGVFSQDGDLPKLPEICALAGKYGAWVLVDDAHGVGVLGRNGKGTADHFDVADSIDLITGTFSKSMGTTGGYAAGSKKLIQYLRLYSRSNTFSASLAPPVVAAASKAIDLFTNDPQYINRLWENTKYIKKKLFDLGFDIGSSETPITPVMIRDDERAFFAARKLFEKGIYVVPATYPAVKLNDSRFRVNITNQHTIEDLNFFCSTLMELNQKYNLELIKK